MRYGVLWALVLPTGFYVLGRQWGTVGLALVWVCVFPLLAVPAYRRVLQAIDLPARAYLLALWPATSASFLMGASVLAIRLAVGEHGALGLRLGAQVVAGAGVYALTCMVLHRERMASFSRMLRTLRAAPRPASEVPVCP